MKKILLLIDVQDDFVIGNDGSKAVLYINNLIKNNLNKYYRIINVTLDDDFGSSVKPLIKRTLKNAKMVWHINKYKSDGSDIVHKLIEFLNLNEKKCRIEVCGMNTDECVYDTVKGLCKIGYKVFVHKDGTSAETIDNYKNGINALKKIGIKLI